MLRKLSWLLFRTVGAAMFMTHGYEKLFGATPQPLIGGMAEVTIGSNIVFPMPMGINALYVAGAVELFAGGLIFLGLFTRLAAFLAAGVMLMAYLTTHLAWFPTWNNGELAAMYFLMYFLLCTYGPGPISLDAMFRRRRF